jgi:triacylglycerol lipase
MALHRAARLPRRRPTSRPLEATLAVLNGVVGDYLYRRGNGLATPCQLLYHGVPYPHGLELLRDATPGAGGRLAVWVHGLCVDEAVWTVPGAPERSFPARLEAELGYVPLLLRYNSGRHVSDNGELLAGILEELVASYPEPVEELLLVGYSMGGLVIRSACHLGAARGHRWLGRVRQAVYLGAPHLGTHFERLGRALAWGLRTFPNAYTHLVASVGDLRSAGIRDLGDGRFLREHWEGADPEAPLPDPHHPLPLLPGIRHGFIAGRIRRGDRDLLAALLGDGMVPLASACAGQDAGCARLRIVPGVGHVGLVRHPEVWAMLRAWCAEGSP